MKLSIKRYGEVHRGTSMAFVIDSGILLDNFDHIAQDLQELANLRIRIHLIHNLANSEQDQEILNRLSIDTESRVDQASDFYRQALDYTKDEKKIIFLERQPIINSLGDRISVITPQDLIEEVKQTGDYYTAIDARNPDLRSLIEGACISVLHEQTQRIHIVPIRGNRAIREELFSLDGIGMMIENNFSQPQIEFADTGDAQIIKGILDGYRKQENLKPRSSEYILENIHSFLVARIDGIPVGCVEIIQWNENTIELAALAVIRTYLSRKIGRELIRRVESYATKRNSMLICVTPNVALQQRLLRNDYILDTEGIYTDRAVKSPKSKLFIKKWK